MAKKERTLRLYLKTTFSSLIDCLYLCALFISIIILKAPSPGASLTLGGPLVVSFTVSKDTTGPFTIGKSVISYGLLPSTALNGDSEVKLLGTTALESARSFSASVILA
jgi:hypothetical protein